jgi:hypothetical protein
MLRPKVKPEHAPYRIARGRKIRIGGVSYGLAAELADPDGWVWTMLAAMDGSRSLPKSSGTCTPGIQASLPAHSSAVPH